MKFKSVVTPFSTNCWSTIKLLTIGNFYLRHFLCRKVIYSLYIAYIKWTVYCWTDTVNQSASDVIFANDTCVRVCVCVCFKGKPSLCSASSQHHEAAWWIESIAPRILNLGTRRRWVLSLTPRSPYHPVKEHRYPLCATRSGDGYFAATGHRTTIHRSSSPTSYQRSKDTQPTRREVIRNYWICKGKGSRYRPGVAQRVPGS